MDTPRAQPVPVLRDLSPLFAPGETLLWQGQPQARFRFRRDDVTFITAPIFFVTGFVVLLFGVVALARTGGESSCAIAGGLALIAYSSTLIYYRVQADVQMSRATDYAVTDRRVLIHCSTLKEPPFSMRFNEMHTVEYREYGDGTGSIGFGIRVDDVRKLYPLLFDQHYGLAEPNFARIRDGRFVHDLVRQQHQLAAQTSQAINE
jgi:hypothetical protein